MNRSNEIAEFISTITLREGGVIQYPVGVENETSPEEMALNFVIEDDAEQLTVQGDSTRLVQRYVLALLWFAVGRFATTDVASNRLWLVANDECQWKGIVCDSISGWVASIDVDWIRIRVKYGCGTRALKELNSRTTDWQALACAFSTHHHTQ